MKMFTVQVAVILVMSTLANGQAMILPADLTVIEGDSAEFACSPFTPFSLPVLQIRPDSESTFENIDTFDPRLTIVMDFPIPNDPSNRTYSYSNLQRTEDGTQFTCTVNGIEATTPVTITVHYPPTYTAPGDQVVVEGMDIVVTLTVEARPAALMPETLTRSGGAVVPDDTIFDAVSVTFVDVERANAGVYTLTSSNAAGQGSVSFTLDVQSIAGLDLSFAGNTPRLGIGTITAELFTNRPEVQITCFLRRTSFVQDCSNGSVTFTNVPAGGYILQAFATDRVTGDIEEIRTRVFVPERNDFCSVNAINGLVSVSGNSASVEFHSTGNPTGFRCSVDRQSYFPCTSPVTIADLDSGRHRLRVRPSGCGRPRSDHRSLSATFDV